VRASAGVSARGVIFGVVRYHVHEPMPLFDRARLRGVKWR
jgi:hypothetical protein